MERTKQTRARDAQKGKLKEGKAMKYITVDSRAIRFHSYGGQTNCFWRDLLRWPRRRFWRSLKNGLRKCW